VAPFRPLARRVETTHIEALLAAAKPTTTVAPPTASPRPASGAITVTTDPTTGPAGAPPAAPASPGSADPGVSLAAEPLAPQCTIDDFAKVDLRVARIIAAEEVPEAKKLLKLTVSLGGEERRTVFAGIKGFHDPLALVGRLVVVVANLAPRQMKFGLSEGMIVAASGAGATGVYLLSPDTGALPGMRLH
jgi:methionyl-tRNA synthetase